MKKRIMRLLIGLFALAGVMQIAVADDWYVSSHFPNSGGLIEDVNDYGNSVGTRNGVLEAYINGNTVNYDEFTHINANTLIINNSDAIAGMRNPLRPDNSGQIIFYLKDGQTQLLNDLINIPAYAKVNDMNDHGKILVTLGNESYVWLTEDNQLINVEDIDPSFNFGAAFFAQTTNNLDTIVGARINVTPENRFDVIVIENGISNILSLPEECTNPASANNTLPQIISINNNGAFVAVCGGGIGSRIAFLYDENDVYTQLNPPQNSVDFYPIGIDDSGQIIGRINYSDNTFALGIYDPATGQISDINSLLAPEEEQFYFDFNSIKFNNAGDIISGFQGLIYTMVENLPPYFNVFQTQQVDEKQLLTYQIPANDYDQEYGHIISYSSANLPSGANLNPQTGIFTWTPNSTQAGLYNIEIIVTDNAIPAESATETLVVTVNDVNSAPVINSVPTITVSEGENISLQLEAIDLDGDDITYSISNPPPFNFQLFDDLGLIYWSTGSADSGTYQFEITATDNGSPAQSSTTIVEVIVENVNRAPFSGIFQTQHQMYDVNSEIIVNVVAGDFIILSGGFTDYDVFTDGQVLTITAVGLPPGAPPINSTGYTSFITTDDMVGNYQIVYTATDDGEPQLSSTPYTVNLNIDSRNHAPVLQFDVQGLQGNENEAISFSISATDIDDGDILTYNAENLPAGATLNSLTGLFEWTPDFTQAGVYSVPVSVSDNGEPVLSDAGTLQISVSNVNRAPIITPIDSITIDEGESIDITIEAVDLEGDSITYSIANQPVTNFQFWESLGKFIWNTSSLDSGIYQLEITATDNGVPALSSTTVLEIVVNNVNRTPKATAVGTQHDNLQVTEENTVLDVEFIEGEYVILSVQFYDPDIYSDGQSLTIDVSGLPPGINALANGYSGFYADASHVGLHQITYIATDNGEPALSSFPVTVNLNILSANEAPIANAGSNQSMHVGEQILLDGAGSSDDNTATAELTYAWAFTSVPTGSTAALVDANTVNPTFISDLPGDYIIELTVTDEGGLSNTASVTASSTNSAPTADAGSAQGSYVGNIVTLNGSASFDPDGDSITYAWTLVSQPAGSTSALSSQTIENPTLVPDLPGEYTVELVVSDAHANSTPTQILLTVITAEQYAEGQLIAALNLVGSLPDSAFTAKGDQKSLSKKLQNVLKHLGKDNLLEAIDKLTKAIERVDGCALRYTPDVKGMDPKETVDFLNKCTDQDPVYMHLINALNALT